MKSLIFIFAFLIGISVQAGMKTTTLNGGTNNIAASATSNYTSQAAISVTGARFIAIQSTFALLSAATNDCTFTLDRSVDNTSWKTNVGSFVVHPNGTNVVIGGTNLDSGGFAYWRIGSITNGAAVAITNLTVKYYYKLGI